MKAEPDNRAVAATDAVELVAADSAARANLAASSRSGLAWASFALVGLIVLAVAGFILVNGNNADVGGAVAASGAGLEEQATPNDDPLLDLVANSAAPTNQTALGAGAEATTDAKRAGRPPTDDDPAATAIEPGGAEGRTRINRSPTVAAIEDRTSSERSSINAAANPDPTESGESAGWAALPVPQPGQLPIPDLLPLDAYAAAEEVVIGTLEIPRLGVSEVLQQGMTLTAINRGPSHWPGTAAPGRRGNVVIAGHRTTHGAPFNGLDKLVPGDAVIFTTLDGTFSYSVREIEIVAPEALHIADQTAHPEATLFACHPKGSAAQRIVARVDLLGAPTDAPANLDPLNAALAG